MKLWTRMFLVMAVATLSLLAGCQSAYYDALESVGIHKRDVLVDRIEDARDSQEDAKEQFQTTLERFAEVVDYDGGDLEKVYNRLNSEFETSEARANQVRDRIAAVESVATALFEEWQEELSQYTNADLRRASQQQLSQTKSRYNRLMQAMGKAESRMEPVLSAFRDQVLYLKHNLNARAIASIENELTSVRSDIDRLVREMNASIDEANAFINAMEQG